MRRITSREEKNRREIIRTVNHSRTKGLVVAFFVTRYYSIGVFSIFSNESIYSPRCLWLLLCLLKRFPPWRRVMGRISDRLRMFLFFSTIGCAMPYSSAIEASSFDNRAIPNFMSFPALVTLRALRWRMGLRPLFLVSKWLLVLFLVAWKVRGSLLDAVTLGLT